MEPGSIAPCSAHDFQGGIAKAEIGEIFKYLVRKKHLNWTFLQNGLKALRAILRHEDKRDLSTRLPGIQYQTPNMNSLEKNLDNLFKRSQIIPIHCLETFWRFNIPPFLSIDFLWLQTRCRGDI
jgi:hypothetical protein